MMTLVDASYRFIYVDIGEYGSNTDGSTFKYSNFGQVFLSGNLDIPPPKTLPNFPEEGLLPHCIVADEVFPLRCDLMQPFPHAQRFRIPQDEQIFNYRLSRARHIVENAFGMLVQRFCVFNRRIGLNADNTTSIVKACCVLHNFLTESKDLATIHNKLNPDGTPSHR